MPFSSLTIGVPRETAEGERRVAATPESLSALVKKGFGVAVQAGAGEGSSFRDGDYERIGARIVRDGPALLASADVVLAVRPPSAQLVSSLKPGALLLSFLYPAVNADTVGALAKRGVTSLGMEQVPRITRAQQYDALSSMANIAGYRAVIEASNVFGRFFTGQITAAGKVPPAKVLVIGGGVAGLSATATARSLGAIVRLFDTRAAVKEQAASLGAAFLEVKGVKESGVSNQYSLIYDAPPRALDFVYKTLSAAGFLCTPGSSCRAWKLVALFWSYILPTRTACSSILLPVCRRALADTPRPCLRSLSTPRWRCSRHRRGR